MFSLLHAAQALQGRMEEAFQEVGLSFARYSVLDQLVRAGEPLALSELAARISCVRSNVTQLVDRLEGDGLVRRIQDPGDRRSIRAELTDAGTARHAEGAARLATVLSEFEAAVPDAGRATLERVVAALG